MALVIMLLLEPFKLSTSEYKEGGESRNWSRRRRSCALCGGNTKIFFSSKKNEEWEFKVRGSEEK